MKQPGDLLRENWSIDLSLFHSIRYEYDSLRGDYDLIPNTNPNEANPPSASLPSSGKNQQMQEKYRQSRQRYERLRDDLTIKLKLLEQYRVRFIFILIH